jgi:hypothetical protein
MNNKYDAIMADEISRKMKSDVWNFQIASGVLAKKRKSAVRGLILSSSVLAAAAAAVMAVFLFGVKTDGPTAGYEQFITRQIEGTRNNIAGGKQILSDNKAEIYEVILQNDTDTMIDETLAMRL